MFRVGICRSVEKVCVQLGVCTREEGADGVFGVFGLFGFFRLPPCLAWDQSFEEELK